LSDKDVPVAPASAPRPSPDDLVLLGLVKDAEVEGGQAAAEAARPGAWKPYLFGFAAFLCGILALPAAIAFSFNLVGVLVAGFGFLLGLFAVAISLTRRGAGLGLSSLGVLACVGAFFGTFMLAGGPRGLTKGLEGWLAKAGPPNNGGKEEGQVTSARSLEDSPVEKSATKGEGTDKGRERPRREEEEDTVLTPPMPARPVAPPRTESPVAPTPPRTESPAPPSNPAPRKQHPALLRGADLWIRNSFQFWESKTVNPIGWRRLGFGLSHIRFKDDDDSWKSLAGEVDCSIQRAKEDLLLRTLYRGGVALRDSWNRKPLIISDLYYLDDDFVFRPVFPQVSVDPPAKKYEPLLPSVKHPALRPGNLWMTWNSAYFQLPPLAEINFNERGTWKPLGDELNSSLRRVKEDLQTVMLYHKGGRPGAEPLQTAITNATKGRWPGPKSFQTNVTIANLLYMDDKGTFRPVFPQLQR
jgi:hypothetical protein